MFMLHLLRLLESVKESGFVSKYNPAGELSLESIYPVHQSLAPVQPTSRIQ